MKTQTAPFITAARRSALLHPLLFALLIPAVIGTTRPQLLHPNMKIFITVMAIVMPICILWRILYEWTINDRPVWLTTVQLVHPFPDEIPIGTNLKFRSIPAVTVLLVLFNVLIFYYAPEDVKYSGTFLPHGDPSFGMIVGSIFTSAFLHGSKNHLLFNGCSWKKIA